MLFCKNRILLGYISVGYMCLQNLIIKFSDVSRFLVIMLVKTTGDFMNDQFHFWFNKDDMYLCKCFRVSLYHIPIYSMIVHFFCHQEDLKYGIKPFILSILWKKILVTFVMIYKKCASSSSSWKKFFWNLDKSSMYLIGLTDSSKGVKLTSHYLKTNWKLSCVCVYYKQPMCWQEKIVVT